MPADFHLETAINLAGKRITYNLDDWGNELSHTEKSKSIYKHDAQATILAV